MEMRTPPLGTYLNPIRLDGQIGKYPDEYKDRSHIWVIPKDGELTKWYRSYSDYCG